MSSPTPTPAPSTPTAPPVQVNVSALIAEGVRWAVPYIVAALVAIGIKFHYNVDPTTTITWVTGVLGTVLTFIAHFLEAKVPALSRILGAKRPAKLTK